MVARRNMLKVLEKDELDRMHSATLSVLDRVGVLVNSDEVLGILAERGCSVDRKTKIVRMSEEIVMDAVRRCEPNFKWHARSEKDTLEAVDGRTKIGPGAECVYFIDPETEAVRLPTRKDGIMCARLLDAMDTASIAYSPVYMSDVPDDYRKLVTIVSGLVNSSKCTFGGSVDKDDVEMSLRIGDIVMGSREQQMKTPMFCGYVDPISPLAHEHTMLEALVGYSRANAPVFVTVMALAGGTAPASLAGLLVQQNAEVLSSIVISGCVTKRPKIIYGSVSCPLDMKSGMSATGAPEFSLLGVGAVQLAKYYNIPSNMGVQSDSKTHDAQAAYEKAFAAVCAVSAGADFSDLFLGATEAFNTFSPIQLMIDDEIATNALRFSKGIEVTDQTLSLEVIGRTGPMGNYLKQRDTVTRFRKEHLVPKLSDRQPREKWSVGGAKEARQRAKERVFELLKSHTPEPLEQEVRAGLVDLLKQHAKGITIDMLEM